MHRAGALAAFVVAFSVLGPTAGATASRAAAPTCDTSWKTDVNGNWNNAARWTNGVPDASTTACLTAYGTFTVWVRSAATVGNLVMGTPDGVYTPSLWLEGVCHSAARLTVLGRAVVEQNAVVQLFDGGCNAASSLETDGGLVNRGLFLVQAKSPHASRQFTGAMTNEGTLRVDGPASLSVVGSIDNWRSATIEMHLFLRGYPSIVSAENTIRLPARLLVTNDPRFTTHQHEWTFCGGCTRDFTDVEGAQLLDGFEVHVHARSDPDGHRSVVARLRRS